MAQTQTCYTAPMLWTTVPCLLLLKWKAVGREGKETDLGTEVSPWKGQRTDGLNKSLGIQAQLFRRWKETVEIFSSFVLNLCIISLPPKHSGNFIKTGISLNMREELMLKYEGEMQISGKYYIVEKVYNV